MLGNRFKETASKAFHIWRYNKTYELFLAQLSCRQNDRQQVPLFATRRQRTVFKTKQLHRFSCAAVRILLLKTVSVVNLVDEKCCSLCTYFQFESEIVNSLTWDSSCKN